MARHREDLGRRRHVRVELYKPGFLIPAPDAPWIECQILDVSDRGACLDVGSLAVPELFGLAFTAGGEVLRVCSLVWRRGELIGARFVTVNELRQGLEPAEAGPKLHRTLRPIKIALALWRQPGLGHGAFDDVALNSSALPGRLADIGAANRNRRRYVLSATAANGGLTEGERWMCRRASSRRAV